jgi:hypothetical protein
VAEVSVKKSTVVLDPDDPDVVHVSVAGRQYLEHADGRVQELGAAPSGGGDGSEYAVVAEASNADVEAIVRAAVEKALAEHGVA